jgi:hypothetical protein
MLRCVISWPPPFFFDRPTLTKHYSPSKRRLLITQRHSITSQNILNFSPIAVSNGHPEFLSRKGADTLYIIYVLVWKLYYEKHANLRAGMQGKLKLTEKEKHLHIRKLLLYFSIYQCTSHQSSSVADLWLKRKSPLTKSCLKNQCPFISLCSGAAALRCTNGSKKLKISQRT